MKEILIIGAGIMIVPTVKVAKSMGLGVTVVDQNIHAPAVQYADDILVPSVYNSGQIINEIKRRGVEKKFNAVFTAGADVEIIVSEVAEALSLPGIPPIVAKRCNDKALMKECLDKEHVATPKSILVTEIDEAVNAIKETGLPAVIKPINNCGSRGISMIKNLTEINEAFELALKYSPDKNILIETFVEGTTHTVEIIALEGNYYVASIIDTIHGFPPYFVELYHVNPTRRPEEDCRKMTDLAQSAARAVGIHQGVAKVDVIFSEKGPQVMEMTARLSGGFHCQYTTPLAHGTNNIRAAIRIALDEKPDMEDIIPQIRRCAISNAMFPTPGVIKSIQGIEEARKIQGIAKIILNKKVGDVVGPYKNAADRPIYIIAHGDNEEAIWLSIKKAEEHIKVITE